MLVLLMVGIYEICSGAMIIHTKLHEDRTRHSEVIREEYTRQQGDLIHLFLFFKNKESRLIS
jgi:hypothetical protein